MKTRLALGLALAIVALAQTKQARFLGRITDADGAPVPSAVIVVCNADADLWLLTSTDRTGSFEIAELPASRFSVEVLPLSGGKCAGREYRTAGQAPRLDE